MIPAGRDWCGQAAHEQLRERVPSPRRHERGLRPRGHAARELHPPARLHEVRTARPGLGNWTRETTFQIVCLTTSLYLWRYQVWDAEDPAPLSNLSLSLSLYIYIHITIYIYIYIYRYNIYIYIYTERERERERELDRERERERERESETDR